MVRNDRYIDSFKYEILICILELAEAEVGVVVFSTIKGGKVRKYLISPVNDVSLSSMLRRGFWERDSFREYAHRRSHNHRRQQAQGALRLQY